MCCVRDTGRLDEAGEEESEVMRELGDLMKLEKKRVKWCKKWGQGREGMEKEFFNSKKKSSKNPTELSSESLILGGDGSASRTPSTWDSKAAPGGL